MYMYCIVNSWYRPVVCVCVVHMHTCAIIVYFLCVLCGCVVCFACGCGNVLVCMYMHVCVGSC